MLCTSIPPVGVFEQVMSGICVSQRRNPSCNPYHNPKYSHPFRLDGTYLSFRPRNRLCRLSYNHLCGLICSRPSHPSITVLVALPISFLLASVVSVGAAAVPAIIIPLSMSSRIFLLQCGFVRLTLLSKSVLGAVIPTTNIRSLPSSKLSSRPSSRPMTCLSK
jgi:hypothetical protein